MFKKVCKNVEAAEKMSFCWNFLIVFVSILAFLPLTHQYPQRQTTVEEDTSDGTNDIIIGPCIWILNKKCPDENIKFYLFTRENVNDRQFIYIDGSKESSNLSMSHYDARHPVKIIIHGYNSDMFLQPLIQMKEEYLQRGSYNLFYVDWSDLAPGPCYLSAVHNSRHTGSCIAQLIERILETGQEDIHMIGFSLGAQVTNFVAAQLLPFKVPRITGLDPAMPLFITASIDNKLDSTDARFVDIIHTNALIQGKIERCGHVDFYMNGGIVQPGCWDNGQNPFACSHHRAPDYYSESIRSYKGFWGWACSSYISYLLGLCPKTGFLVVAGEDTIPTTRGMFLISTNKESPFAIGRWTTIAPIIKSHFNNINAPYNKEVDPLQKQIDEWGKLEGYFNNVHNDPFSNPGSDKWQKYNEIADSRWETESDYNNYDNNKELLENSKQLDKYESENYASRKYFMEQYKKNLTMGFIDKNVFQQPEVILKSKK